MIRTHIPARPRNKKIVPTGGSSIAPIAPSGGSSHSHSNKPVIDKLTQLNIDVLSYLSLYQTGVEMEPELDEYGQPVLDVNGNPVMVPVEVPVLDELGRPVLDVNGDPVTEQIPVYAIKSTATFFSEKEVSAYGLGEEEGGGGGGGYDMLLSWTNYSTETEQWVISAALAKDMLDRIVVLEAGGGGGSNVEWGTESGGYVLLTVDSVSKSVALSGHTHSWSSITGKPSTFTPSAHFHAISDVTDLQTELDGKSNTGHKHLWADITDKPSTFTPSAHSHGWSEITDKPSTFTPSAHGHGWSEITDKPSTFTPSAHSHSVADISDLSATLGSYVTVDTTQTISGAKTFSAALTASVSVTTPKVIFAAAGWSLEQSGTELQMKYNGTAKMRFLSGGSIVATQEITAYS